LASGTPYRKSYRRHHPPLPSPFPPPHRPSGPFSADYLGRMFRDELPARPMWQLRVIRACELSAQILLLVLTAPTLNNSASTPFLPTSGSKGYSQSLSASLALKVFSSLPALLLPELHGRRAGPFHRLSIDLDVSDPCFLPPATSIKAWDWCSYCSHPVTVRPDRGFSPPCGIPQSANIGLNISWILPRMLISCVVITLFDT